MRRVTLESLLLATAVVACSGDRAPTDTVGADETQILLTDAPFPYDSVTRVDVWIERIEASVGGDTIGGSADWRVIAEPRRAFDLLDLQNGRTALLGQTTIPAGAYRALRMTLDTRRSQVLAKDGAMNVDWGHSAGTPTLYALVEQPLEVGDGGGSIVIDFDVGRSFLCLGAYCSGTLTFTPVFRAVNSNTTGSIAGTVRGETTAGVAPVANAAITLYRGDVNLPRTGWFAAATGKTDAQGNFKLAYVHPGTYIVRIDAPRGSRLVAHEVAPVTVTARDETAIQPVTLARGEPIEIELSIRTALLTVGDTAAIEAVVVGESGPVAAPQIAWSSSAPGIVSVTPADEAPSRALVSAIAAGTATITAQHAGRTASATFVVAPPPSTRPVATVQLSPASLNVTVGDSASMRAILRDADGGQIGAGSVTWASSDPAVVRIRHAFDVYAILEPLTPGTATITGTFGGKTGEATVVVKAKP